MELTVAPGKYIVAVSGGVDSVVLLDLLAKHAGLVLIVAHFDHGIRPDSGEDKKLVEKLAQKHGLPFAYEEGKLGTTTSEATARKARYAFLRKVMAEHDAKAIITAHHQDDLLETAIINILRGTGRKGLTALDSHGDVLRPLLNIPKRALIEHAQQHELLWHEDSTNDDTRYLRNYIRHEVLPKLGNEGREKLLQVIGRQRSINSELDQLLAEQLYSQTALDRQQFVNLSHKEACEVMAGWLRLQGRQDFDRRTIERLVIGAKTAVPGKRIMVKSGTALLVERRTLALVGIER